VIALRTTDDDTEPLVRSPGLPAGEPGDPLPPGTPAGSWRLTARIAAGGCGVVYAARHPVLDRVAAVKVLHAELASSPIMVDRFVREARAVNQIRHPNIVDIFDFGALGDGRPFLVMELLGARDLEQRIADSGRLTLDEILAITAPICSALDAAHRAGYIHRDLKARNIGFAADAGGAEIPKLLDFGIAKLLEDGRDGATGTIRVGTPHCMSPEQIRGERVDARTDVYALGVLLHHMLTGRYPFEADGPAELERLHLEAPAPAPSRLVPVSPALDAVVTRALAKTAALRPGSAGELLGELTAAARAPGPRRAAAGVAIHVTLELPARFDDHDLDDAAVATERCTALLAAHGFAAVLVTATSVLAARLGEPAAGSASARRVAALLELALATRPRARPQVTARIAVRAAPVEVEAETGAFTGGPLLDLEAWPR